MAELAQCPHHTLPGGAIHVDDDMIRAHCCIGGAHWRMGGDKSGLVMGCVLLFSPTYPDPFSLPSPQNRGQTSPNCCGLQKPVLRLGLVFLFCD